MKKKKKKILLYVKSISFLIGKIEVGSNFETLSARGIGWDIPSLIPIIKNSDFVPINNLSSSILKIEVLSGIGIS